MFGLKNSTTVEMFILVETYFNERRFQAVSLNILRDPIDSYLAYMNLYRLKRKKSVHLQNKTASIFIKKR